MEFYLHPRFAERFLGGFQFPTGWNSTGFFLSHHFPYIIVSIPNGMEFYCLFYRFLRVGYKFQFPTVWNSTAHRRGEKLCRCGVSIPNGMEFYEGISSRLRVSSLVSIPNGMEFYADMLQKDFAYTPLFQFPTGWNSTLSIPPQI